MKIDAFGRFQFLITLRHVTSRQSTEKFINFVAVENKTSDDLSSVLTDSLRHFKGRSGCSSVRGCVQKFPDWLPEARTANGTALCH
jgi:hypothetical protein